MAAHISAKASDSRACVEMSIHACIASRMLVSRSRAWRLRTAQRHPRSRRVGSSDRAASHVTGQSSLDSLAFRPVSESYTAENELN